VTPQAAVLPVTPQAAALPVTPQAAALPVTPQAAALPVALQKKGPLVIPRKDAARNVQQQGGGKKQKIFPCVSLKRV